MIRVFFIIFLLCNSSVASQEDATKDVISSEPKGSLLREVLQHPVGRAACICGAGCVGGCAAGTCLGGVAAGGVGVCAALTKTAPAIAFAEAKAIVAMFWASFCGGVAGGFFSAIKASDYIRPEEK